MTDAAKKKTYWFASGGRKLAQPICWQGWTFFGIWLVALIGGSQMIIARGITTIGTFPAIALGMSNAVLLVAIYYFVVKKMTDAQRSPEDYWAEQEAKKK